MTNLNLKIDNQTARALWLSATGLAKPPTGPLDLMSIIRELGFVQLDTIQVISRAHHHILWSRNQNYREQMLDKIMVDDRSIFEHFTHDASVLPMEFLPMWRRQFQRRKQLIDRSGWFKSMLDQDGREEIKARIRTEGPLSTHAFDTKVKGKKQMWARPPHKLALDYMWYSGELATCHRVNFTKFYDLAENVFPTHLTNEILTDESQVEWLCKSALDRMSFATIGEINKFWEATDLNEVKQWVENNKEIKAVDVQASDGTWSTAFARADIEDRIANLEKPTSRLRILNPFDPAIRDRIRLERLFGFSYRIEMFVPAAKRQWGYYVYPILEAGRFVGRIEIKADRKNNELNVLQFWPENGVRWGDQRVVKLQAEISRLAKFVDVRKINWHCQI